MHNRYILILIFASMLSVQINAQERELVQIVIGNEGNFGAGNATLTNFAADVHTATDGVFLSANGTGIGDVVQSLSWINNQIYAVVNNSQKIVILDPDTFQQTGQITFPEGSSPREILKISESKAYVTDLYSGAVYIVNLQDNTVSETTIPVGMNPDQIIGFNGFAFVANNGFGADSTISMIDTEADTVYNLIEVSRGPAGMAIDSENRLWVVCTGYAGDYDEEFNLIEGTSRPGGLHAIDLSLTGSGDIFAELPSAGSDLLLNDEEGFVYVNNGGVRAFDISEQAFSADTLVKGNYYAMGYDASSKVIYLADAKDFSSAGEVSYYGEFTEDSGTFSAGIIPGSFLFIYNDMLTSTEEKEENLLNFSLSQNYPNPFNPVTNIEFSIPTSGYVTIEVFSSSGQKVARLINGIQPAGTQNVSFDASQLSSGLYLYRITTSSGSLTRKMLLIK